MHKRCKGCYFHKLEESVRNKISGWSKSFLSMGGRATLLSYVLGSIPIHTLFILPVPKGCIKRIESIMANFLWDSCQNSRRHWVSWQKVCSLNSEGGLGIIPLADVKKAVLSKLTWRFMLGTDSRISPRDRLYGRLYSPSYKTLGVRAAAL
ncbi:hypothetical protein QQ045_023428 [Rhodiola kirilowii]